MDRDQRWERVAAGLRSAGRRPRPVHGRRPRWPASNAAYARGENDEFVKPTAIVDGAGAPATMADGDVVVFMNFRADRARQMTRALTDPAFSGFPRAACRSSARTSASRPTATSSRTCPSPSPRSTIRNSFGEYISPRRADASLRIAETEKYAHVTYFFNGGVEDVYPGEDRILVPSPKVATYDLKPEMSAPEVTDRLVEAIASGTYDAIVCNYANSDMVGHTGNFEAARRGGRDARRLHRTRGDRGTRRRRRGADHRRSRQCRDDARPGDGPGAHGAHVEPRPVRVRRTARRPSRRAARCRTSRRRCWRSWACRNRRK